MPERIVRMMLVESPWGDGNGDPPTEHGAYWVHQMQLVHSFMQRTATQLATQRLQSDEYAFSVFTREEVESIQRTLSEAIENVRAGLGQTTSGLRDEIRAAIDGLMGRILTEPLIHELEQRVLATVDGRLNELDRRIEALERRPH